MELSRTDRDLLQLTAIEVPWPMVCAEFHSSYGSVESLVARLFELLDAGLISVSGKSGAEAAPDPLALCAEALAHGNFEAPDLVAESSWCIAATNAGYALIKAELNGQ